MASELDKLLCKYRWIRNKGSNKFTNEVAITSLPHKTQLRNFIKGYMLNVSRCLTLSSYYWKNGTDENLLTPEELKKTMKMLQDLNLEFGPWQFHFLTQEDFFQFECSWTEADEKDPKYK